MTRRTWRLAVAWAIGGGIASPSATAGHRSPLDEFLRHHKELRLLALDDAPSSRDLLEADRAFSPTATGDATGDEVPDLAAVLVRTLGDRKQFSIVCFHGKGKGRFKSGVWVVRDQSEPIVGVSIKAAPGLIWAWHCYPCDDITDYRWNGAQYEDVTPRP